MAGVRLPESLFGDLKDRRALLDHSFGMVRNDSFSLWEKRRMFDPFQRKGSLRHVSPLGKRSGIFFSGRDGISLDQAF